MIDATIQKLWAGGSGILTSVNIGGEEMFNASWAGKEIIATKNRELAELMLMVYDQRNGEPFLIGKEPASKLTDLELVATIMYHKHRSNPHHWIDFRKNGMVENKFGVNPQYIDGRSPMGAPAAELVGDYYDTAPELARRFLELRATVLTEPTNED
jgi:hypothetical protein